MKMQLRMETIDRPKKRLETRVGGIRAVVDPARRSVRDKDINTLAADHAQEDVPPDQTASLACHLALRELIPASSIEHRSLEPGGDHTVAIAAPKRNDPSIEISATSRSRQDFPAFREQRGVMIPVNVPQWCVEKRYQVLEVVVREIPAGQNGVNRPHRAKSGWC